MALTIACGGSMASEMNNLFFLHHSTGRNLLTEGSVRDYIEDYNSNHGTDFKLWDHDYNYIGLKNPPGYLLGYDYEVPGDNTDPDGLFTLFTTSNAARDSIIANHQVIAFKSCYPASHIEDEAELNQYKAWYLEMRDFFDQHPDRVFVVMSQPPLHRLATNLTEADNARAFADWLKSDEYLAGHDNVVCFDFFDQLAAPDDAGSDNRNMLRYEYESSHSSADSHPNDLANQTVGPVWAAFMIASAVTSSTTPAPVASVPLAVELGANYPNPFNPQTAIEFSLGSDGHARVSIHDAAGRLVKILASGLYTAGSHELVWDGRGSSGQPMPSGVYLCRITTTGGEAVRSMTLVK